jgi:hypothetical protein
MKLRTVSWLRTVGLNILCSVLVVLVAARIWQDFHLHGWHPGLAATVCEAMLCSLGLLYYLPIVADYRGLKKEPKKLWWNILLVLLLGSYWVDWLRSLWK